MNVTATGAIGQEVVEQLRTRGHAVTAYMRSPGKVPASWGRDVTVVTGEITDAAAIDRAVAGADAVVSALGPSMDRKATGLSQYTARFWPIRRGRAESPGSRRGRRR